MLLPVSSREADRVTRMGLEAFEDALDDLNTPATNLHRKSLARQTVVGVHARKSRSFSLSPGE